MENHQWVEFRYWLFGADEAPEQKTWLQKLYLQHGQALAARIAKKPIIKAAIKAWMDLMLK